MARARHMVVTIRFVITLALAVTVSVTPAMFAESAYGRKCTGKSAHKCSSVFPLNEVFAVEHCNNAIVRECRKGMLTINELINF